MQYGPKTDWRTKTVGIVAVVVVNVVFGWVLISGLGGRVVEMVVETTVAEIVEDEPPPPPEDPPPPPPEVAPPPQAQIPPPEITFDNPPPPTQNTIQAVQAGEPEVNVIAPPAPPAPPAPTGPTTNPTLSSRAGLPDYPEVSRRLEEEGITTVNVCVGPNGRVDGEATLVASSGSDRLDRAALSWIEDQRFEAGMTNGVEERKCRDLEIEWDLDQ